MKSRPQTPTIQIPKSDNLLNSETGALVSAKPTTAASSILAPAPVAGATSTSILLASPVSDTSLPRRKRSSSTSTTSSSSPTSARLITSLFGIPIALAKYSVNKVVSLLPEGRIKSTVEGAISTVSTVLSTAVGNAVAPGTLYGGGTSLKRRGSLLWTPLSAYPPKSAGFLTDGKTLESELDLKAKDSPREKGEDFLAALRSTLKERKFSGQIIPRQSISIDPSQDRDGASSNHHSPSTISSSCPEFTESEAALIPYRTITSQRASLTYTPSTEPRFHAALARAYQSFSTTTSTSTNSSTPNLTPTQTATTATKSITSRLTTTSKTTATSSLTLTTCLTQAAAAAAASLSTSLVDSPTSLLSPTLSTYNHQHHLKIKSTTVSWTNYIPTPTSADPSLSPRLFHKGCWPVGKSEMDEDEQVSPRLKRVPSAPARYGGMVVTRF
ncbi:hypothetical protein HDV05_004445 [Chytridiales sp. JEL 0842]|nr:hypothetical protein HDV05_004445 [Chytridiales sp. JEL 0842]